MPTVRPFHALRYAIEPLDDLVAPPYDVISDAQRLEYLDREGSRQVVDAKDFFARVAQHETDHLNGHVYIDRMRDLSTLSHIAEWQRYWLGVREQSD